jgi:hypothetical protein
MLLQCPASNLRESMTPIEKQFRELAEKKAGATCVPLPDGSHVVVVPNIPLPPGWNANTTTVAFVAPVGFPASRPDCFWTDPNLRLASGINPQNTGSNPLPGSNQAHLWFSWHVQKWSPNSDSLSTYLHVIESRFGEPR